MKVGVLQLSSKLDPEGNLEIINKLLKEAKAQAVQAAFLPECFYSMSDGLTPTPFLVEEQNEHYQNIKQLAVEYELYLLGGSAATRVGDKIINRNYNFSPQGAALSSYDKINLFSIVASQKNKAVPSLDESKIYTPGKDLVMIDVEKFKIGMSICFDLRFPEMYRNYFSQGANVLSISSAFTQFTGKAHWHTLLRARAIENQCYVMASAQWGQHNERVKTYGHSLIVDPWGEILQDAGEGEKLIVAEINLTSLQEVRSRMNVS